MQNKKILIIGAGGQIGTELTLALRAKFGNDSVIATDIKDEPAVLAGTGPYMQLDATDAAGTRKIVEAEGITDIYLLAALLSATGEKNPELAWNLNMSSLRQVLELCKEKNIALFWPSSIAVFGATTPSDTTPQKTIIEPTTMYGITKYAGELLCQYYANRYGVDVRSVRYPGLISWKSEPGGGTTDYAVDIFYKAITDKKYTCFLSENTYLPMMYMDDAIRATIELMETPCESLQTHMAYNLSAMSFSPKEIATEIQKHIAEFEISYAPDQRQVIADGWPSSIDDSAAQNDWHWKPEFDLTKMTAVMLRELMQKLQK